MIIQVLVTFGDCWRWCVLVWSFVIDASWPPLPTLRTMGSNAFIWYIDEENFLSWNCMLLLDCDFLWGFEIWMKLLSCKIAGLTTWSLLIHDQWSDSRFLSFCDFVAAVCLLGNVGLVGIWALPFYIINSWWY